MFYSIVFQGTVCFRVRCVSGYFVFQSAMCFRVLCVLWRCVFQDAVCFTVPCHVMCLRVLCVLWCCVFQDAVCFRIRVPCVSGYLTGFLQAFLGQQLSNGLPPQGHYVKSVFDVAHFVTCLTLLSL